MAHEKIIVHEVPLKEVHDWLEAKTKANVMIDPKSLRGALFYPEKPMSSTVVISERERIWDGLWGSLWEMRQARQ